MAIEGLERLGYHNGQRLEAGDLRLEQRYHIDVRRLLHRGLFTPGVVSGFEVERVVRADGSLEGRKLGVRRGVALDPLGREIILREDVQVDVPNQPPTSGIGYFLIARYSERAVAGGDPWCGPDGAPTPARVREEPVLEWSEDVPTHARCQTGCEGLDCGVLLALAVLDAACEVAHVQTGVREYARPTHVSQVQAFSFEGEKDIDAANAKELNFRIRGGAPASVALYLWGGKFSSLFYTELGRHTHSFKKRTGPATTSLAAHTHKLSAHTHPITDPPAHRHSFWANTSDSSGPITEPQQKGIWVSSAVDTSYGYLDLAPTQDIGGGVPGTPSFIRDTRVRFVDANGNRIHTGTPSPDDTGPATPSTGTGRESHDHSIPESDFAGVTNARARSGSNEKAHTFLADLRVALDGQDITQFILDRYVPQSWGTLGNGQRGHPFNGRDGTGPIDLLEIAPEIGVDLGAESHWLTFSVANGGGKVLYNLYVA